MDLVESVVAAESGPAGPSHQAAEGSLLGPHRVGLDQRGGPEPGFEVEAQVDHMTHDRPAHKA
jgi:hypothetical protein